MKKFLQFTLKPHKKEIFLILTLTIIETTLQILIIDLLKKSLKYVEIKNINNLIITGSEMLILTAIVTISMILSSYIVNKVSIEIAYQTRKKIFHNLMQLPTNEIYKFKSTGLMSRTTRGVYSEQGFIRVILKNILILPIATIGILIAILFIDVNFAKYFIIFIIIITILSVYKIKKVVNTYLKVKKTYGTINFQFREKILGLKTIILFKKRLFEKNKFKHTIKESYNKSLKYQLEQYYISPLLILSIQLFVIFTLIIIFDYSIDPSLGQATTKEYTAELIKSIAIIQYLIYFLSKLIILPKFINTWPKAYATSIRLEEVLYINDKINNGNKNKTIKSNFKGIEFKNVSFTSNNKEIIKNVSFKIKDKTTVAIVGDKASGKTTLMYLLDALYPINEGEILIDGININDYSLKELRGKINFAMQKTFLFNDTIYNNIVLGNKKVTKEDVDTACQKTGLKELFNDNVNLDTIIFENATNISQNTKNKIMLTRSIVEDKEIYIFDEHNYQIPDRTNIILTCEIEQIKEIENIILLDKGQIIGCGNHNKLLKESEIYQKLYKGGKL